MTASRVVDLVRDMADWDQSSFTDGQVASWNAIQGKFKGYTVVLSPAGSNTQLQYNNSGVFAGAAGATYQSSGRILTVSALTGTDIPLTVKAAPTQSGNLTEWVDSSNVTKAWVASDGTVSFAGAVTLPGFTSGSVLFAGTSGLVSQNNANFFWDNTNTRLGLGTALPSSQLHVKSLATGNIPVIAQGFAGQTANLFEARNSSGTVLAKITSLGGMDLAGPGYPPSGADPVLVIHPYPSGAGNHTGILVDDGYSRHIFRVDLTQPAGYSAVNVSLGSPGLGEGILFRSVGSTDFTGTVASIKNTYNSLCFTANNGLQLNSPTLVGPYTYLGGGPPSPQLSVVASAASVVALVLQGAVSQTGNLFEARNSSGTALTYVAAGGHIVTGDFGTSSAVNVGIGAANTGFFKDISFNVINASLNGTVISRWGVGSYYVLGNCQINSASQFSWSSGTAGTNSADTALVRSSAAVVKVTDGSTGTGSLIATQLSAAAPASGAGNSLTLAGSAAVSGNNNGGDVVLTPGALSGTGFVGNVVLSGGQIRVPAGSASRPTLANDFNNRGTGVYFVNDSVNFSCNTVPIFGAQLTYVVLSSAAAIGWSPNTGLTSGLDTSFTRSAASVIKATNGSSGLGALICGQPTTGTIGLTVQAIASATANLQEWQNSSGVVKLAANLNGTSAHGRLVIATGGYSDNGLILSSDAATGGGSASGTISYSTSDYFLFSKPIKYSVAIEGNTGRQWLANNYLSGITFESQASSTGQVAYVFTTQNALSTTPLISFRNNGTEFASIGPSGATLVNPVSTAVVPLTLKASATKAPSVSNKALTSNVATLTTSTAHGFYVGETVVVTGVDSTFNGTYTIASVPSTTTFTYAKTASDVTSQSATGTATVSQTATLLEGKNTSNTVVYSVNGAGFIYSTGGLGIRGNPVSGSALTVYSDTVNSIINCQYASSSVFTVGAAGGITVASGNSSWIVATFKGAASQSANLTEWQDSSGTALTYINPSGFPYWPGGNFYDGGQGAGTGVGIKSNSHMALTTNSGYGLYVKTDAFNLIAQSTNCGVMLTLDGEQSNSYSQVPACVYLRIKSANLQTANMTEWRYSGTSTNLAYVGPSGNFFVNPGSTAAVPLTLKASATKAPSVSNKALTSNVATLTTSTAHGFYVGETVVVTGVDSTFNGTYTVASVPSTTTFTYALTASNVTSQSATGTATVSQTANLITAQDSSGTTYAGLTSTFTLQFGGPTTSFSGVTSIKRYDTWGNGYLLDWEATGAGNGARVFQVSANNSGYGGVTMSTAEVEFTIQGAVKRSSGVGVLMLAASTGVTPLGVRCVASQSANLTEWQNSSGTVLTYITSDGKIVATSGTSTSPSITFANQTSTGFYLYSSSAIGVINNSTLWAAMFNAQFSVNSSTSFKWSASSDPTAGWDTGLARSSAAVVKATNGSSGLGALICGQPTTGTIGLVVQAITSASANLQEWWNSGGTTTAAMTPTKFYGPSGSVIAGQGPGITFIANGNSGLAANSSNLGMWESGTLALNLTSAYKEFRIPSDFYYSWSSATNNNSVSDTKLSRAAPGVIQFGQGSTYHAIICGQPTTGTVGLTVQAITSATANLQEWQNSSGTALAAIVPSGDFRTYSGAGIVLGSLTTSLAAQGYLRVGVGTMDSTTVTLLNAVSSGNKALVVQGVSGQTANLQEWQNNSGTALAKITKDGYLATPQISSGGTTPLVITAHSTGLTTDADAATITFDLSTSNDHQVQLAGNRILALANDAVGQKFSIILQQDATGSRTVTWWSGILWAGGVAPTLTTTANKRDVLTFWKLSAGVYIGAMAFANC